MTEQLQVPKSKIHTEEFFNVMKIKQLVLISLIVFSLGCMGVMIAGLAFTGGNTARWSSQ
ncbi:MAG: hypothetical protein U0526_00030 [Candidatus Saccharibacteria bacterium]